MSATTCGKLAAEAGYRLPLQPLQSANGFYLGTRDEEGPVTRESVEYFPSEQAACDAMVSGRWTQRTDV